jgi:tRNA-intron endonuclease
MAGKIQTEFIENFLVVWDPTDGSRLYRQGYYGKPLGIPKPKTMEFNVPLILDLMEGLYLAEKRTIAVEEGARKKKSVNLKTLRQRAHRLYDEFDIKYAVYRDLRENGLIVTPGIKFGCDFAVYKQGPGVEHAPFMVSVKKAKDEVSATEIVKTGRLATTVRKRFIIAVPETGIGKIRYLIFKWFKA